MIQLVSFETAENLYKYLDYPKPGYIGGSRDAYAIREFDYSPMLSDYITSAKIGDKIYDFNNIWPDCDDISDRIISAPTIYGVKEYIYDKYGIFISQSIELSKIYTTSYVINRNPWKDYNELKPPHQLEITRISKANPYCGDVNPQKEIEGLINLLIDQLKRLLK